MLRRIVGTVPLSGPTAVGATERHPAEAAAGALCAAATRAFAVDIDRRRDAAPAGANASAASLSFPGSAVRDGAGAPTQSTPTNSEPVMEVDGDGIAGSIVAWASCGGPRGAIRELLRDLAQRYPGPTDSGMLETLATIPDVSGDSEGGGVRPTLRAFLRTFVFGPASPHAPMKLATDGACSGTGAATTLYLALHHATPAVRARAVRFAASAAVGANGVAVGDDGSVTVDVGSAFARASVLELLQDDDEDVAQAALDAAASLLPPLPESGAVDHRDKTTRDSSPGSLWANELQALLASTVVPVWASQAHVRGSAAAVAAAALQLVPRAAAAAAADTPPLSAILGLLPLPSLLPNGAALMSTLANEALCCLVALGRSAATAFQLPRNEPVRVPKSCRGEVGAPLESRLGPR